MPLTPQTIQLTPLQISHTIAAVRAHMSALLQKSQDEPEGGEHEDYLIAQSVLKILAKAEEAADPASNQD
jgi:hypothetical protein